MHHTTHMCVLSAQPALARPALAHIALLWPLLLALSATPAPAQSPAQHTAQHYAMLAAASQVSAKVAFFGLASKTAQFPLREGRLTIDPQRGQLLALDVLVDAANLTAGDAVTQSRLRGPDFFDVAHFPLLHFTGRTMVMTGPQTAQITGDLTARGQTRPFTLSVQFTEPIAKLASAPSIQLVARGSLDRTSFGMNAYPLVVGRKVGITIHATLARP